MSIKFEFKQSLIKIIKRGAHERLTHRHAMIIDFQRLFLGASYSARLMFWSKERKFQIVNLKLNI